MTVLESRKPSTNSRDLSSEEAAARRMLQESNETLLAVAKAVAKRMDTPTFALGLEYLKAAEALEVGATYRIFASQASNLLTRLDNNKIDWACFNEEYARRWLTTDPHSKWKFNEALGKKFYDKGTTSYPSPELRMRVLRQALLCKLETERMP